MANDYFDDGHSSIQAALLHSGINADFLEACLKAAERITAEPVFTRWPSVPIRGYG